MPLLVVCLVPAAPALLPWLTGTHVPEVEPVREAVRRVLADLAGLDRVVVVSAEEPGTLAGFGAVPASAPGAAAGERPGGGAVQTSWPRELADALLDGALDAEPVAAEPVDAANGTARPVRQHHRWSAVPDGLVPTLDGAGDRVGLLLLADGSRTRGPRAPGGEDPRGDAVDAELVAALRQGRPADVPDAAAVGATAGPAVALLAEAPGGGTELLHDDAPLGVCYLVARRRRDRS
ncbi:hypothetical protein [Jannaschia sp. R86511]|uniref:hypothetical protein n=1 Tax=Jannaschia sp. R86511 TaxID=3093853 RepID=UPI0036D31177